METSQSWSDVPQHGKSRIVVKWRKQNCRSDSRSCQSIRHPPSTFDNGKAESVRSEAGTEESDEPRFELFRKLQNAAPESHKNVFIKAKFEV